MAIDPSDGAGAAGAGGLDPELQQSIILTKVDWVSEVIQLPGHPYTSALLSCEVTIDQPRLPNASDNRFRIVPGDLPDPRLPILGCIFQNRCDFAFEPCTTVIPPDYTTGGDTTHVARCHLRRTQ